MMRINRIISNSGTFNPYVSQLREKFIPLTPIGLKGS